jgi:GR25 family glycosyltransferase involved in LPS biosynthesis
MSLLNTFFDGIFCLNIDDRTDRWENCKREFKRHGITNVTRFSAIKGSKLALPWSNNVDANGYVHPPHLNGANAGGIGGNLSFMSMIKTAKILGWNNFLVLEDDVVFHPDLNNLLEKIIPQVPYDWDLFYFGGNHFSRMPEQLTENLFKTFHTVCLHAFAINHTMYDRIIEQNHRIDRPTDINIAQLQQNCLTLVTNPHLAWQRAGYSDVQTSDQHYGFLEKFEESIPEQYREQWRKNV